MATEIRTIQNDKLYDLNFTLQDSEGKVIILTDVSLRFNCQLVESPELRISGEMFINDPAAGKCSYQVQPGDFEIAGRYYAEVEATFASGQVITFSNITVIVEPELPKNV